MTIKAELNLSTENLDTFETWLYELENCPWSLVKEKPEETFYKIEGFFPSEEAAHKACKQLREAFPHLEKAHYQTIKDEDWQNAYKKFLKPWSYQCLHWVPFWEKASYEIPSGHFALYMDAGMAFGTGTHETTQLCAKRLVDYYKKDSLKNKKIIDAGCGSGILALSCALMEPSINSIKAFDIDPIALDVCLENAQKNHLENRVNWAAEGLEAGLSFGPVDIVFANIQCDVLCKHKEILLEAIKPKGHLILSGILKHEKEEALNAFQSAALKHWGNISEIHSQDQNEWSDIVLVR